MAKGGVEVAYQPPKSVARLFGHPYSLLGQTNGANPPMGPFELGHMSLLASETLAPSSGKSHKGDRDTTLGTWRPEIAQPHPLTNEGCGGASVVPRHLFGQ